MSAYTLDTNIIIGMHKLYPRDVPLFAPLWDAIEKAICDGELCICPEVHKELYRSGDDLYEWARDQPDFICDVTDAEVLLATQISLDHPGWVSGKRNAADPWLVAHGKVEKVIVVTNEKRAGYGVEDHNLKVPNVATDHNVDCLDFLDFLREQNWAV